MVKTSLFTTHKALPKHNCSNGGIAFTDVSDYNKVPNNADIIIVGSNAIPADRSTDPRWLGYAAAGKKVIVLDQAYPLSYKAIPGDMTLTPYVGRFGFSQDLSHPIYNGPHAS